MAMEPARKKASPPHKTAIVILIAFALFCISSLTLVTSCWYSATNTNFEGLPSGVLASPTSSNYVWRFLAPDVAAALAAELKQQHVTSVALLRCDINSTITNSFAIVGVIPTCIKKLADVDQYLRSYAPGMGAPRAAIVRLRHDRAAEDLSTSLLEAQLLSAAPGGSNAVAFGEISYGNTTTPLRAILLHPHGWETGGNKQLWFRETNAYLDAFNEVYRKKAWNNGEGGGSGEGSTVEYTLELRKELPSIIKRYNINSMLDSSCGSMTWMPLVLREVQRDRPNFKFFGSDVVCPLVQQHKRNFTNEKNWQFACLDFAHQRLPKGYELVFSRDALQHIPLHATWQFLNNVRASGARYLLVGSYLDYKAPNRDVAPGDYYGINLLEPPFNLRPQPLQVIDEHSEKVEKWEHVQKKYMLLFDLQTLEWDDPLHGMV